MWIMARLRLMHHMSRIISLSSDIDVHAERKVGHHKAPGVQIFEIVGLASMKERGSSQHV